MSPILIPKSNEPPTITLVIDGKRRGVLKNDEDDGYYGKLVIRKGDLVVRLPVTDKQADILAKMHVSEWT